MRFAVVSRTTSPSCTKHPTAFHDGASSSDREVMALPIDSCFVRPRGTDTWPFVSKYGGIERESRNGCHPRHLVTERPRQNRPVLVRPGVNPFSARRAPNSARL